MKTTAVRVLIVVSIAIWSVVFYRSARAQGFVDEPTCYSWEGGARSAGSFSKCPGPWIVASAPRPAPMVAAPVVHAVPTVCPPQITVIPEPHKPIVRRHRPPPPKCLP